MCHVIHQHWRRIYNELSKLYKVEYMQPVDMFPQTSHVEVVSQIVLKEEAGSR